MGCTGWAASRGIASRGCRGSDSPAAPIAALARNLAGDAKPTNARVAAVGRCSTASNPFGSAAVAVDREAVASSTLEQSRDGGCNKAATAVATKPLRRLQQSRYGGCNKAATAVATAVTAVATKPLRRLQQPLPLQLVTAALHVPQSVAGAARRRPALGEPSRTGLHHCKDYKQSATVATGANDAVGARAASR